MPTRTRLKGAAALAALMVLSACGSTVQPTDAAGQAAADGLQQAPAAPGANGAANGGTGLTGGAASGLGGGAAAGSGGAAPLAGGTTGSGAQAPGAVAGGDTAGDGTSTGTGAGQAMGPGVTATEIRLGIPFCNDCDEANAGLGAAGENPGDTREYYKTALEDVNARGGVLGRKLVPVFHEVSVSQNIDASAQEACATWTQDNKVFAVFFRGEATAACGKKAGIMAVGSGGSGPMFARYPNLFAPYSVRLERLGAVTVKAMVRANWHKPEAKWPTGKIGLITWDDNEYLYAMKNGWLPALHAAGLKETDVRYVAVPQSDKSLADASAAVSSAVLSFREKGIDHVFISDGPAGIFAGTGLTFLFLQNAESQRYYPRYGFNGNNSPGWSNLPAAQQAGMLAVDSIDIERINDDGIPLNPQRERCWGLMKNKGLPVGAYNTQQVAIGACDIAWFTEAVLKVAKGTLLPDVIAAGESLGTTYRSPWNYGNRFARGQHDGAALFRNAGFEQVCGCMKYTSKPYEP